MPRIMFDSVNPFAIPADAKMVLVYVDGIYKWSQAGRDRFRHAKQVTCSAIGAVTAQVGDVEKDCIWPPHKAPGWVLRARADGYDPTVYVNEMNDWGPVREAFRVAGVREPHYWVANYNGVRAIPAGSVGRQYAHPSTPPGNPQGPWHTAGHWDESWIADYWPGVDNGGPGGGGGNEDDVLSVDQDNRLIELVRLASDLHATVVSGDKTDAQLKEDLGYMLDELPRRITVPVTMTETDRDAIAEKVRLGLLADLAPLFELAERLKD